MKKVLVLMLAMVLVLSLAACGGSNGEDSKNDTSIEDSKNDINISEFAIGTWECSYTATETDTSFHDYSAGDRLVKTIEFFEGGVYKYDLYNSSTNEYIKTNINGDWTVEGDCIKLIFGTEGPFKPDYEKGTLIDVTDKNQVYSKK